MVGTTQHEVWVARNPRAAPSLSYIFIKVFVACAELSRSVC